jgi:protein DGCR14
MLENDTTNDTDVIKSLDTWTYTTKNSLMYVPEGVALNSEEELNKSKKVRVIKHENTRFTPEALKKLYMINQSRLNGEDDDKSSNSLNNPLAKIGVDGKNANPKSTPKVKGYSFVDATPSPMPGRMAGDESPMMVWGEIGSTPMRLDPSATPLPPNLAGAPEFKMPEPPERERIAFELEEKASAERRRKKNEALKLVQRNMIISPRGAGSSPASSSPSLTDKLSNMSPAAQRLLSAKLGLKSDRIGFGNSPITTSPSSSQTPTSISKHSPYISFNSPVIKSSANQSIKNLKSSLVKRSSDSLTDNLLNLPKNT